MTVPKRIDIDEQNLPDLVSASGSWSDLFEALGFQGRPGSRTQARIRQAVREAGIDHSHFHVQRGPLLEWNEDDLRRSAAAASSWKDVQRDLRCSYRTARKYAEQWGIDVSHVEAAGHMRAPSTPPLDDGGLTPERLRYASESIAKSWYMLRGFDTFEPERTSVVDLLILDAGEYRKVQVKTASRRAGSNWNVGISKHLPGTDRKGFSFYDASEIDEFFIVALDGSMYRIPLLAVEHKRSVCLGRKYDGYRVSMF